MIEALIVGFGVLLALAAVVLLPLLLLGLVVKVLVGLLGFTFKMAGGLLGLLAKAFLLVSMGVVALLLLLGGVVALPLIPLLLLGGAVWLLLRLFRPRPTRVAARGVPVAP